MLMIGRKQNQGVWIGRSHVIVAEIQSGKVRLGIQAPPDIVISRDELIGDAHLDGDPVAITVVPCDRKLDDIRTRTLETIAVASAEIKRATHEAIACYWRGERMAANRVLAILDRE